MQMPDLPLTQVWASAQLRCLTSVINGYQCLMPYLAILPKCPNIESLKTKVQKHNVNMTINSTDKSALCLVDRCVPASNFKTSGPRSAPYYSRAAAPRAPAPTRPRPPHRRARRDAPAFVCDGNHTGGNAARCHDAGCRPRTRAPDGKDANAERLAATPSRAIGVSASVGTAAWRDAHPAAAKALQFAAPTGRCRRCR